MTKNRSSQYNKQTLFYEVKTMPWHWRPLLGPVWVEETKQRKSMEKERSHKTEESLEEIQKTEIEKTGTAKKTAPAAGETTLADTEKPAVPEKLAAAEIPATDDKPTAAGEFNAYRAAAAVRKKFEEVSPGVFRFKTGGGTALHNEKGLDELSRILTEMAGRGSGALPSSIGTYKKISKTSNGIPVYTFK
ncbi:MAG: hypothetical protein AB1426_01250 [Bacillota bacterium]